MMMASACFVAFSFLLLSLIRFCGRNILKTLPTGTPASRHASFRLSILLSATLCASTASAGWNPFGWFVTSDSKGNISPSNAVASVKEVAAAVAADETARLKAEINAGIADSVSNEVTKIAAVINSLEGVGYIDGYVLSFEGSQSVDTNASSQIVHFEYDPDYSPQQSGMVYYKLNTWISADVDGTPVVRVCSTLGRTNNWASATVVSNFEESVLARVNGRDSIVETYGQIVEVPAAYAHSFFRVYAKLLGSGSSTLFAVNNGFSVNGQPGLTMAFTNGTNIVTFTGGIRTKD